MNSNRNIKTDICLSGKIDWKRRHKFFPSGLDVPWGSLLAFELGDDVACFEERAM